MANPLARVIMTNLVDMDKSGEKKSSGSSEYKDYSFKSVKKSSFSSGRSNRSRDFRIDKKRNSQSNISSDINLSPSQENLLLDIIGGGKKSGGRKSMANGYKSNSNSSVKGISLEDLAGDKLGGTNPSAASNNSYSAKSSYGQKSNNYGKKMNTTTSSGIKTISFEQLAGGVKPASSNSYIASSNRKKQQGTVKGGMISLEELGKEKSVNISKDKNKKTESYKSEIKSSVIGKLEGYVPKVSLNSIGKSSKF